MMDVGILGEKELDLRRPKVDKGTPYYTKEH